ncbi:MAG: nodulation protein NfeD [Actinobacteria bacterium]|nr:nodulation protein NfeD [Actinomycetota bacterium]
MARRSDRNRRKRKDLRSPSGQPARRAVLLASGILAIILALILAGSFPGDSGQAADSQGGVLVIPVEGVIDPAMSDYITRNISEASQNGNSIVVLSIDTPGGLDQSMRDIIKEMNGSPLPVVAWVAPSGARAASAGTFMVTASDVAAMASGTNLGAAHPVAIGADLSSDEGIKITNDSAAYIRSLAEANGRNANWAELAVRQSVSLTADEALEKQVVEFRADTMDSLLSQLDGYTTKAKGITIETTDVPVSEAGKDLKEELMSLLFNPNVAYLLFIYGLIAIIYEFVHPGIGFGGVSGTIALLLSLYSLYMLPVSYTGLALVLAGVVMLVMELYITSHGALTIGGVACLILGSFFLFDSSAPFLRVAWPVNIALALMAVAFFVLVASKVMKARRMPARTGQKAMVGEIGYTRSQLDPLGQIFVRGEIWSAEAPEGQTIEKGVEVEVVDVRGLMLKVIRSNK